jgi:hypothetical protein
LRVRESENPTNSPLLTLCNIRSTTTASNRLAVGTRRRTDELFVVPRQLSRYIRRSPGWRARSDPRLREFGMSDRRISRKTRMAALSPLPLMLLPLAEDAGDGTSNPSSTWGAGPDQYLKSGELTRTVLEACPCCHRVAPSVNVAVAVTDTGAAKPPATVILMFT